MIESVHLAKKAKVIFETEVTESDSLQRPILIVLSLGPFGAILTPTQEFRGCYPPPYGPRRYSDNHTNQNSFDQNESEKEHIAIDALTKFHFERLLIFASSTEAWNAVDCLAFETVPLKREVTAIRRAIQSLQRRLTEEGREGEIKPWWVSCVFPDGESPGDLRPGGPKVQIDEMLATAFSFEKNELDPLPIPSGFGINCTKPQYLPALAATVGRYFKTLPSGASSPWLILYPNGDDVYDEVTRSWSGKKEGSPDEWGEEISKIIVGIMDAEMDFGGIIVGGCCKAGPDHISSLRSKCKCFPNTIV